MFWVSLNWSLDFMSIFTIILSVLSFNYYGDNLPTKVYKITRTNANKLQISPSIVTLSESSNYQLVLSVFSPSNETYFDEYKKSFETIQTNYIYFPKVKVTTYDLDMSYAGVEFDFKKDSIIIDLRDSNHELNEIKYKSELEELTDAIGYCILYTLRESNIKTLNSIKIAIVFPEKWKKYSCTKSFTIKEAQVKWKISDKLYYNQDN